MLIGTNDMMLVGALGDFSALLLVPPNRKGVGAGAGGADALREGLRKKNTASLHLLSGQSVGRHVNNLQLMMLFEKLLSNGFGCE